MSDYTLQRAERLRSLKAIRRLFTDGRGGFVYPFRYMMFVEEPSADADSFDRGVEVMFSVPKKFHKRANKRNLLKRRMREAYRLNREELRVKLEEGGKRINLALVYSTKDVLSYKTIENAVQRILHKVCERM